MAGWMGTLNDWFTNEGFGAFTVKSGKLADGDKDEILKLAKQFRDSYLAGGKRGA